MWRCRTIFNCVDACPRGINITQAILEVQQRGRGDSRLSPRALTDLERVVIRADGAARGNPRPAASGAVIIDASRPDARSPDAPPVAVISRPLGIQTNNYAEYTGVILALEKAVELGAREVELVLDSMLIVEQLSGRWKIKHPQIRPLAARAHGAAAKPRSLVDPSRTTREQSPGRCDGQPRAG